MGVAGQSKLLGFTLIVLATIIWGSTGIATKFALAGGFDVFTISTLTIALASLTLLPLGLIKGFRPIRHDLIVYGIIVLGGFRVSYTYSIQYNGAGVASALLYTAPVIVAIMAPIILKDRCKLPNIVLAIVAFSGAYITSNPSMKFSTVTGFLIGLVPAFLYAVEIIAIKIFYNRKYSLTTIMYQSLPASIILPLIALVLTGFRLGSGAIAWSAVIWIGVMCVAIALLLYIAGLRHIDAVAASIISTVEPVSALIMAILILGETFLPIQFVGIGAIILSSVSVTLLEILSK
jgi:DME family drug/metabolite transporter